METRIINDITFTQEDYDNLAFRKTLHIPLWIKDWELYVLDSLFFHLPYPTSTDTSTFHGATFSVFEKFNQEMIDDRRENADADLWIDAVQNAETTLSLSDWCEQLEDEVFYDNSYQDEWWYDELVEKVKTVEGWEDTEFFNCTGGGRSYQEWMETPEYWDISFLDEVPENILRTLKDFEH